MHKKRRRILPFVPSGDGARRLKQLTSLATALTTSKTEFSNELAYMPNMAPRSSNLARLEVGGIQVRKSFHMNSVTTICCFVVLILLSLTFKVLHKEDKESIELCRTMQKRGEFPPLLVVFDSQKGYYLKLTTLS
jgi:hypothetical protein